MLILTRKPGESLFIGDQIKVTVIEIKGNQIRVGIEAPKDMRIYREEIWLQIMEENKEAAAHTGGEVFEAVYASLSDKSAVESGSKKLVVKPVSGMNLAKGKGVPSVVIRKKKSDKSES